MPHSRNGRPKRVFPIKVDNFHHVGMDALEGETNVPEPNDMVGVSVASATLAADKPGDGGGGT
ncbi:hypothetical protein [Nonomuraea pusilla]|uniref:Uncharacterized protein n=1 Tax=Nonomuraea pusilla TaxID=46177 RepID=A0A1H8CZC7_9ACTN|nr:hypothetical protein [Nonomuraea pusilla]SEN00370.1 hypothetical protein SAMN05660976_06601 [Nonomuraea pusilla]